MTFFAGIYSRSREYAPPEAACETLKRVISRNSGDEVNVLNDERSFFVKVDIGAFGEAALHVAPPGSVSLLAGEPLLSLDDGTDIWQSRTRDLELLHKAWERDEWELLARAQGVFCAAHYEPQTGRLSLIADKLGVRPLYYWAGEQFVVFATALRIFESLDLVPKEMDLRAVTELAGLGVPLGTRTPYANIHLLKAAEVVSVEGPTLTRQQYWRWDELAPSQRPSTELVRDAYERFARAVARRLRRDTTTFAFLSGGLDSRCVVAALRERKVQLHTFNFSPAGSQDQIFGAEFARLIGAIHEEPGREEGRSPDWSLMMANVWRDSRQRSATRPAERPALAWSGDGGSVGLGFVYMNRRIVELMRAGETDAAIDAYLLEEQAGVPHRLFKPDVADALASVLQTGVRQELDDIRCGDAGRSFHLFLMLNDQRRHLSAHFENIDLHRLELQLPFYDSDFLAAVLAVPVDLCLGHKFYMQFLACFPPEATSVPWQTYPGHEPCPLPIPSGLAYQWDSHARRESHRQYLLGQAAEILGANDFPERIFKRGYLNLAALIYRTGLRDYGYVIEAARTYYRYWNLCGGSYVLPSSASEQSV